MPPAKPEIVDLGPRARRSTLGIVATRPRLVSIVAGDEFEDAVGPLRLVMVGAGSPWGPSPRSSGTSWSPLDHQV